MGAVILPDESRIMAMSIGSSHSAGGESKISLAHVRASCVNLGRGCKCNEAHTGYFSESCMLLKEDVPDKPRDQMTDRHTL